LSDCKEGGCQTAATVGVWHCEEDGRWRIGRSIMTGEVNEGRGGFVSPGFC
jgi:protocatechuate 3,4-dioxygenase beta subunit